MSLLRICVLLLLLAVGAIVNIAVAWTVIGITPIRITPYSFEPGRMIEDQERIDRRTQSLRAAGWRPTAWDEHYVYRVEGVPLDDALRLCCLWSEQQDLNPDWVGIHQGFMVNRPAAIEYGAGWPWQCLTGETWNATPFDGGGMATPQWVANDVIVLQGTGNGFDRLSNALPFRLVWPGFAINTIFYAAILWLIFFMPFALRKRRRIKRGLCPMCAYDLRGSAPDSVTCPECGAPVPPPLSAGRVGGAGGS